MDCNKLTSVSHMGGEAAVGADSSRPSPQRSEAKRVSIPSAPAEWPDYFVKSHQSARKMPGACVEEQKYGRAQRMFMWRNTKVWRCCVCPFRFIANTPKEKRLYPQDMYKRRFLKIEYLDLDYKQGLAFCQLKNWIRVYEEFEAINQEEGENAL